MAVNEVVAIDLLKLKLKESEAQYDKVVAHAHQIHGAINMLKSVIAKIECLEKLETAIPSSVRAALSMLPNDAEVKSHG